MNRFLALLLLPAVALATTAPQYNPSQQKFNAPQQRSGGFGANVGVGGNFNDGFGVSGGLNVGGNPGYNNGNDFLMPIVIGLGLLSLFNIVLTILTPLFTGIDDTKRVSEDEDEEERRYGRGLNLSEFTDLASKVHSAVQKFQEMQK